MSKKIVLVIEYRIIEFINWVYTTGLDKYLKEDAYKYKSNIFSNLKKVQCNKTPVFSTKFVCGEFVFIRVSRPEHTYSIDGVSYIEDLRDEANKYFDRQELSAYCFRALNRNTNSKVSK